MCRTGYVVLVMLLFFPSFLPAFYTNQPADVVVGQPNMTSNPTPTVGGTTALNYYYPQRVFSDGQKMYVAIHNQNRVLIYNHIPTSNHAPADVVVGQSLMTSDLADQGNASCGNTTLQYPCDVFSDGTRLFIADTGNNRVLIYNQIPTTNNVAADIVLGQPDMMHEAENQGLTNSCAANTLFNPTSVFYDGTRLFISDYNNNRVVIFNQLPTANNAFADVVVGQANMLGNLKNQNDGTVCTGRSLWCPDNLYSDGTRLLIGDSMNLRVVIFNTIPTSNDTHANLVIGQVNLDTRDSVGSNAALGWTIVVSMKNQHIYLADHWKNRVLVFNSIPLANNPTPDTVIGQPDMSGVTINQTGTTDSCESNTLYYPKGSMCDGNRLYINDSYNQRILIYYSTLYANSISVDHSLPNRSVSMDILGNSLLATSSVKLTNGGTEIIASNLVMHTPNRLSCQFDLPHVTGAFDLRVTSKIGLQEDETSLLPKCFFVLQPLSNPIQWQVNDLGQAGSASGSRAGVQVSDGNNDGLQEVYVANGGTRLQCLKKTANWAVAPLPETYLSCLDTVVADGDRDGNREVYGALTTITSQFKWVLNAWQQENINTGTDPVNKLATGDGNNDGKTEIYCASADKSVYQFKMVHGEWKKASIKSGATGPITAVATGDGNNDKSEEVYAAFSSGIYQYKFNGSSWIESNVDTGIVGNINDIVVANGDGNGSQEIYAAHDNGKLYQFEYSGGIWHSTTITAFSAAAYEVVISDADNDGTDEIYAACADGHVYQIKKNGTQWQQADLGSVGTALYALAVGDGDNDNQFEVYASGANGHVYQIKAVPAAPTPTVTPTATNTPTPAITPELTGNQIKAFYNQINPLKGERVLIRWHQAETVATTIRVYNLNGDLIKTLADKVEYAQGIEHELQWDGTNVEGTSVGSGIYIIYIQAGSYQSRVKAAVVK